MVAVAAAVLALLVPLLAPPAAAAAPEWNIDRIGAPAPAGGAVIAVVDTGVDAAHPALMGRVLPAIDLVDDGRGGDPNGHGTHVAGTAAGADNGCGAIGVAPEASILPVLVLDEEGAGTVDVVADGIRQAADRGATVINLSLGADVVLRNVSGNGLEEAIRYAWSKGSIPVLAAGNDGLVGGIFGSGYGDLPAVVVTATDHRDRAAPYATSIGSAMWGVAAPGGDASGEPGRDILSAFPDRQCALQAGTSMAAPHVSGALAALRAKGLDPRQAVERLLSTARDLGDPGTYGSGLIDVRAALGGAPTTPSRPPAPAPGPADRPASPGGAGAPSGQAPATTVVRGGDLRGAPATSSGPTGAPVVTGEVAPDAAGGVAVDGDDVTTTQPRSPVGGSASPVVVRDADDGGDDVPGALVAAAVGALAVSGVGAGAVSRSIRRRPGIP